MSRLAMHKPRRGDGDTILVTRRVAAHWAHRSPDYIRQVCQPIACDVRSRAVLYDLDALLAQFARRVA